MTPNAHPMPSAYPISFAPAPPTLATLDRSRTNPKTIDILWRLFNAWPGHSPRLEKAKAAANRMASRHAVQPMLPRSAFASTAAYYDAILPLAIANRRFRDHLHPGSHFRAVHYVLASMLPEISGYKPKI